MSVLKNSRLYWVNTFWADISAQLRRLSVIEPSLYDGLQLRKDVFIGHWLITELRAKYKFFKKDCNWVTVIVCPLHNGSKLDWNLEWWLRRPGGAAAGSIEAYSTFEFLNDDTFTVDMSGSRHLVAISQVPTETAQHMKRVFGPGNPAYDYWDFDAVKNYAVGTQCEGNVPMLSGNGGHSADNSMPYPVTTMGDVSHGLPDDDCARAMTPVPKSEQL